MADPKVLDSGRIGRTLKARRQASQAPKAGREKGAGRIPLSPLTKTLLAEKVKFVAYFFHNLVDYEKNKNRLGGDRAHRPL